MNTKSLFLLACLTAAATAQATTPADTVKAKGKSAAQLTQQYVKYLRQTATNEVKPVMARQGDHASVTRDSTSVDESQRVDPSVFGGKTSQQRPPQGGQRPPRGQQKPGGNQNMRDRFEQFKKGSQKKYDDFRAECNKKYAQFLRQAWAKFNGEDPVPEPQELQPVPPEQAPEPNAIWPFKSRRHKAKQVKEYHPDPQPQPVAPVPEVREESQPNWFTFGYCGTEMKVRLDQRNKFSLPDGRDNNRVADLWAECSGQKFNNVIHDCLNLRSDYRLGDWAYLKMLEALGNAFYGAGSNEATFFTAFVYCQSGYKMRFASTSDGKLRMLYATKSVIYEKPYFQMDGTNYYTLSGQDTSLSISNARFDKESNMDLYMTVEQALAQNRSNNRIIKARDFEDLSVSVTINQNQLAFYDTYPSSYVGGNVMTRWAMYANTPLEEEVKRQIYPTLKKHLEGKTELQQVSMLLNFVQTGLEYAYDEDVWGHDRAFFAEESLFYPFCDCEDRAILFTRLVRDLVGLDAILVFYPGHLASAIHFNEKFTGDYIQAEDGRQFMVCDPTYIGSWPGQTMPRYKDSNDSAQFILLKRG